METVEVDCGLRRYSINGGAPLCFNPTDPAVFARLEQLADPQNMPLDQGVTAMEQYLLQGLEEAFPGNDIRACLGGVSLMAMAQNGKLVFHNLLEKLMQILTDGMDRLAQALIAES